MDKPVHLPETAISWNYFLARVQDFTDISWKYYESDQKEYSGEWVTSVTNVYDAFKVLLDTIDQEHKEYIARNK